MTWLLRYAARAWSLLALVPPRAAATVEEGAATAAKAAKQATTLETPTCLICEKPYLQRSSLTRHFQKKHVAGGTFEHPFPCPQCCRDGLDAPTISSPAEWSDHVGKQHGKTNVPVFAKAARPDDAEFPASRRPRKPAGAKRKREETTGPSMPGISVFDFSGEPVRKKPRGHDEEVTATSVKSEIMCSSDELIFGHTPCDPCFDQVGGCRSNDSDLGSSGSGNGYSPSGFSPVSSADIDTPLESPVLSSFEFVPVDTALLADMDDGPWLGLETWNDADDAGWQWAAGADAAGQEGSLKTCDFLEYGGLGLRGDGGGG